jgi:enamine deaminase RidA (YjgF/YER057c/UK114 family)
VLGFVSCSGVADCRSCLHDARFLGGAFFGAALPEDTAALAVVRVPVPVLAGDPTEGECWVGGGRVTLDRDGDSGVRFAHDGEFVFGVLQLREADFAGGPCSPLQAATEAAYRAVFAMMDRLGYPHLVRCWNYLADINGELDGLERYRHFNVGRQDAFLAAARETAGSVPAACALGTRDSDLLICFLAGKAAALPIENPRQVSAFRYPAAYGPRSPTFARAAVLPLPGRPLLLVSGTASIVGHATVHVGDLRAQLRESMANIVAVVAEANRKGGAEFRLAELDYRIYLRRAADLALAEQVFDAHFVGQQKPHAVFLQADVCRHDLLVEIEASGYAGR